MEWALPGLGRVAKRFCRNRPTSPTKPSPVERVFLKQTEKTKNIVQILTFSGLREKLKQLANRATQKWNDKKNALRRFGRERERQSRWRTIATEVLLLLTKNGYVGAGRDWFRSQRFGGDSATIAAGMTRIRIEQRESSIP